MINAAVASRTGSPWAAQCRGAVEHSSEVRMACSSKVQCVAEQHTASRYCPSWLLLFFWNSYFLIKWAEFSSCQLSQYSLKIFLSVSLQGSFLPALSTVCVFVNPCAIHEAPEYITRTSSWFCHNWPAWRVQSLCSRGCKWEFCSRCLGIRADPWQS